MENHNHHSANQPGLANSRGYPGWLGAAIMVGIIAGFYVLREHWQHALGIAPYLLLLACPLIHIFMHGRHGHEKKHNHPARR